MIVVVMGVSGSGKSTIGALLARRLDCEFIEGDEFHPPANVAKMAAGTPLTDEDRWPWLEVLNERMKKLESAVLACSALRQTYRARLSRGVAGCRFVYLHGSPELLHERVAARKHRYMPASLLASQLATLEPPGDAIKVDVADSPERCVEQILQHLR